MASIMSGLFAGRAGIQSHGTAISVLADNIANSNTVGFKAGRAEFTDLLAGSISGSGSSAVGSGSNVSAVTEVFNQGTFENTGRGLDLAIDGNGFFVVQDNGARYYTRAGNFKIDASGNLLNQNGLQVLGFPASGAGGLQALNVNQVTQQSSPTTTISIGGNLNASAEASTAKNTPVATDGWTQLSSKAAFSTTADVYDALGKAHTVTTFFFHMDSTTSGGQTYSNWLAKAYVDSSDVTGTGSGTPVAMTNGQATLTFDGNGVRTNTPASGSYDFSSMTPPGGWKDGATSSPVNLTFSPFTQFSSASNIANITNDGRGAGNIVSFNVESDGRLYATLDNGQTTTIGTVALATFSNPEGLRRDGNSLYSKTSDSGEAVIGRPGAGQAGSLQSGELELSTSDMAADFIKLISLQRGYQGSSRVITSINDMLNEVMNIVR